MWGSLLGRIGLGCLDLQEKYMSQGFHFGLQSVGMSSWGP